MQQKRFRQLWVGLGGASLCLLLLGTRAFAQTTTEVQPVVVTGTVLTGVAQSDSATTIVTGTIQSEPGLLVGAVEQDGPAAKAGLARGDIILQVNDRLINNVADLQALLANTKAGVQVNITVQHGDATRKLTVTLGEREGNAFLGIVPFAVHPTRPKVIIRQLDKPEPLIGDGTSMEVSSTVHVLGVIKDGPADKAGLQAGDLIVSVNGRPLSPEMGLGGVIKALQPGDKITVEIERKASAQTVERTIILGENPGQPKQAFLGLQVMPNVITINKKFTRPMPGNQFMYAMPAPYLGWMLVQPYAGLPPMMMPYQNGFIMPAPNPQENSSIIVIASPEAGSEEQSFSSMPPMLIDQNELFLSMPGMNSGSVDTLNAAPAAPAEPQFFYRTSPAQPPAPSTNPVQSEEGEDVTL